MQKPMTIQEVAKLAGVSVATVSRVLNKSPLVKPKTCEKVMAVVEKFDYQPNLLGRDLRRSETMKVLVLTSSLDRSFFGDIVAGMEARAQEDGYYVLICPTADNVEREKELFQMVKNRLADGVIVISSTLPEEELSALGQRHSIVQCCETKDASHTCQVSVDDEEAAYEAVRHLIESGYRKIGLIGGPDMLNSTHLREQGYRRALNQYQIPYREEWVKYCSGDHMEGIRITNEMLELADRPSAFFCMSDNIAVGCINALQRNGIAIPADTAVIGFDNTREATMISPALTTVHQPKYDLGYAAMDLLIHNMTSVEKRYEKVTLAHELVERESTPVRNP